MNILTKRIVDLGESSCKAELDRIINGNAASESDPLLHFDTGVLTNLLALYILTPFLISVTANFASVKLSSKWIRDQSARTLRGAIQERIGTEIRISDPALREECVIVVEELLKPYGVRREDARAIVDLLTRNLTNPIRPPDQNAQTQ